MEKFAAIDIQRGYKICSTCIENVYVLNDSQNIQKFVTCKTCGSLDVVPVKTFFDMEEKK